MLSSGSVALNPAMKADHSGFFYNLIYSALYYIYTDLEKAQQLYLASKDVLDVVVCHAPALMPGLTPTGYKLSLTDANSILSFADLGVAMVEMADRRDEFKGQGVGVLATGKVEQDWWNNARNIARGLVMYALPESVFYGLRSLGWV